MVIVCKDKYNNDDDEINSHFNKFPFPLSDFQKHAIEGIVKGDHVLVTAHTGSGKTLPAEFAIDYFCSRGKRVIYTSPIKALSNEKYHDFTKKFPNYSIGILTGDIKFNPDANLLIMTTEILQNHLYKRLQESTVATSALNFEMDIDIDLACVIFDEIHYINDADRRKVWEETILMLPKQISMVMLSATIDKPEKFANWCENRHKDSNKNVILTGTEHRVVPLKHYTYINSTEHLFKILKDKDKEKEIKKFIRVPQIIKDASGIHEETILSSNKIINLMHQKKSYTKPGHILNSLITYLYQNEMLPGICFVFSRVNVEKYANQITVNLFGYDDAHVPSIISNECDNIIRKLPNYKEYKILKEYIDLVSLMEKGVAIHHSGMMPILREMVEIIFGRGYIKVLFATETFAVGINMPTKTVVFTALSKYTSDGHRHLLSHEYTQMAGRAGRRGLDTLGHVIHCNNMFRENVSLMEYKTILSGKPQILQSKFKISYSLLLNLIALNKVSYSEYVESSMLRDELSNTINGFQYQISELETLADKYKSDILISNIQLEPINEYIEINKTISYLNNKKKKLAYNKIKQIEDAYGKQFNRHYEVIKKLKETDIEIERNKKSMDGVNSYVMDNINIVLNILHENGFIEKDEDDKYQLTLKGKIASNINECNSLIMAELIYEGKLEELTVNELVGFMSCFSNISVAEDYKQHTTSKNSISSIMKDYKHMSNKYIDLENHYGIHTGSHVDVHYDLIDESYDWCSAKDEEDCVNITNILMEKNVFIGEFVKAILKINNVANECIGACEYIGNIQLSEKLSKISDTTLKYIILQQSLYI